MSGAVPAARGLQGQRAAGGAGPCAGGSSGGARAALEEQTSCFPANTLKENGGEMDKVPLQNNPAVLPVSMLAEALLLP